MKNEQIFEEAENFLCETNGEWGESSFFHTDELESEITDLLEICGFESTREKLRDDVESFREYLERNDEYEPVELIREALRGVPSDKFREWAEKILEKA